MRPSPTPSVPVSVPAEPARRSWSVPPAWLEAWDRLPFRLRRVLRPRALVRWCGVVAAATITAVAVSGALEGVRSEARAGRLVPTLVVRAAVAPGGVLSAANAEVALRPAGERPSGALGALVPGAVASAALVPGEAVVAERLAPPGASPVAARLAPGQRGVALPVAEGTLPLAVGDRVDVVATLPIDLAGPEGGAGLVVAAAVVVAVAVDPDTVVVGVGEADLAPLAGALAEGTVLVVLRPPAG